MAQKTNVTIIDDMDGSEGAETTAFAFAGVEYEIDLSEDNFNEFSEVLAPYIEKARRVGGRRTKSRRSKTTSVHDNEASLIREWAQKNGEDVSERGRIPASLRERYHAATSASKES